MTIDLDVAPAGRVRRGERRTSVIVVAALVLALVAASAPPSHAPGITPVFEGDGRGITAGLLTGTAVFTQHSTSEDRSADIWARPIEPGGPEWITKVAGPGAGLWLDRSGTMLVSESGDGGETTLLDARTGHVRWRTGQHSSVQAVGAAVTDRVPPGPLRVRDGAGRAARVDLATGRVEAEPGAGDVVDGLQFAYGGERTLIRGLADGRVLGEIPKVAAGACIAAADLFACRTVDARFRVWRVRRA